MNPTNLPFDSEAMLAGLRAWVGALPFVVQSIDAARAVNARARPLYEKALEALKAVVA